MNPETIKLISAVVCIIGGIPYIIQTYRRNIDPQITSWALWSLIALAILVTYDSASDGASYWVAVVSFINPSIITVMLVMQGGMKRKLNRLDYACIAFGIAAIACWFWMRDNRHLAQYALYLALLVDLCAAVPTIRFVWTDPKEDRPGAWLIFALGMGISLFAVTDYTPANMTYAVYMVLGSTSTALPLVLYRVRHRIPLKEWI